MTQTFLVGSRAFFAGMEGFQPSDRNILRLVGNPAFKAGKEITGRKTNVFTYTRETAKQMVDNTLASGKTIKVGKFLVPDVARAIGLTIEELQKLKPLVSRLGAKQSYQKIIFNAYIENNDFKLTQEQRQAAYETYLAARV